MHVVALYPCVVTISEFVLTDILTCCTCPFFLIHQMICGSLSTVELDGFSRRWTSCSICYMQENKIYHVSKITSLHRNRIEGYTSNPEDVIADCAVETMEIYLHSGLQGTYVTTHTRTRETKKKSKQSANHPIWCRASDCCCMRTAASFTSSSSSLFSIDKILNRHITDTNKVLKLNNKTVKESERGWYLCLMWRLFIYLFIFLC